MSGNKSENAAAGPHGPGPRAAWPWDHRFPAGRPPEWLVDEVMGQDPVPPDQLAIYGPWAGRYAAERAAAAAREAAERAARDGLHIIDCDADPVTPDGWTVEEHRRGGMFAFGPAKVALHLSDRQKNGGTVRGNALRKELASRPVLNANVLDWLLAHPERIPEEWKGKAVFFWGTVYRARHGNLYVRFLFWYGVRWLWDSRWLFNDWNDNNPAATPAS
jgi:hypothetical protein